MGVTSEESSSLWGNITATSTAALSSGSRAGAGAQPEAWGNNYPGKDWQGVRLSQTIEHMMHCWLMSWLRVQSLSQNIVTSNAGGLCLLWFSQRGYPALDV
jgi:hypothetical protein